MKPTAPGKPITLKCRCNFAPGFEWLSRFEFIPRQGEIAVREWIDADDTWQDLDPLHGLPAWRQVACYLTQLDTDHCVPSDALAKVVVQGVKGWRANLLALCWCRFGEEKQLNYGAYLVCLTDRQLQLLWRDYSAGPSRPPGSDSMLEDLEKLRKLISAKDFARRLARPVGRRSAPLKPGFLGRLIAALEKKSGDAQEVAERVGRQPGVLRLISQVSAAWSHPSGFIGSLSHSSRVKELRDWVVSFFLSQGRLPHGRHKVGDLGQIDFGPATCATFTH